MSRRTRQQIAEALRDGDALDRAMVAAQRRVVLEHRLRGIPLVMWRDGQVVEVPPESVELPGEDPDAETGR